MANFSRMSPWRRLIRFKTPEGKIEYGEPINIDASGALAPLPELRARLISGDPFDPLNSVVSTKEVAVSKLLSPVNPPIVLGIGLNYLRHLREFSNSSEPKHPVMFMKPSNSVIGTNENIVVPPIAENQTDYEAELAVVIGRHYKTGALCKNLPQTLDGVQEGSLQDPLAYVAGYTIANDVTARSWQKAIPQWGFSKSFDTYCPIGPQIVSARHLQPSPLAISLKLTSNNSTPELMQSSSTSDMIFNVSKIVAFLSQGTTLMPGTVIITGTPEGVGMGRNPPRWLKHGDEVEVEIEGIGKLTNQVVWESKIQNN
ncbi:hypothetical protein HK098_002628 [Nowakowskiella sp. JEL0407]|nr:hypothetical protein HK098_002628 [Nowakowskiella sp. JEL0407]